MKEKKKHRKNKWKIILLAMIVIMIGIVVGIRLQKPLVCIDAGHGGKDVRQYCKQWKRYEKDDTLEMALKVKSYLEKQGINVIMTREGDEFVTLQDRCKKANWVMADLFVSIHRNSAEGGDGVEVWISNGEDEESSKLASSILQKIDQVGMQTNRGVKTGTSENSEADYFVNKNTKMPSCLIELGFISNKKDNELWDKNVEQYAEGIAEGIMQNLEK